MFALFFTCMCAMQGDLEICETLALHALACKWHGCPVDICAGCRLHLPGLIRTSRGCCASAAWRTSSRRGPRTASSPSTSRCLVRRARARGSHAGVPHYSPDRAWCGGALGLHAHGAAADTQPGQGCDVDIVGLPGQASALRWRRTGRPTSPPTRSRRAAPCSRGAACLPRAAGR